MDYFEFINSKIYSKSAPCAITDILSKYHSQGYVIVNYVYFHQIYNFLIKQHNELYKEALAQGDFLLPDGVALWSILKSRYKKEVCNLNGTDFLPLFLTHLKDKGETFNLHMWGAKESVIQSATQYAQEHFGNVEFYQDGYSELDKDMLVQSLKPGLNILLLGRSTARTPLQEIRAHENREFIKKHNLLVFNQGGTFDFWAGSEIRAPKLVQQMRAEWLWRLLTNPKKNFKKATESLLTIKYMIGR